MEKKVLTVLLERRIEETAKILGVSSKELKGLLLELLQKELA